MARPRGPWILLLTVAALCIATSVTFPIYDPDVWQHLAVGRWIWQAHALPHQEIWTWPTYGTPAVTPSWLFRVLLWPAWAVGGVAGLEAWRWVTTLVTFAVLGLTARRMGAGGTATVVLLVVAALIWRQRSMVRPETLTAILLALELWILECRREGLRDDTPWLVPLLWIWVQAHVSFVFGFAVLAIYAADASLGPRRSFRPALALAAAAAVAFLNPYGSGLVWQPFEFLLHQRNEPLFRSIDELQRVNWTLNDRNGLPVLMAGWIVLVLVGVARRRGDRVEGVMCAVFTALALGSQRFTGFYALVAAVFVARDVTRLASPPRRAARNAGRQDVRQGAPPAAPPHALRWTQAAIAAAACVLVCVPEWSRPAPALGLGLDLGGYPVEACQFVTAHGVRGRAFNVFYHGGYLLWRFGAALDRLPFIDVHQAGTPELRAAYVAAFASRPGWQALDRAHAFDWVVLPRRQAPGDSLLDALDEDPAFARVFVDDDAALYVRRAGAMAMVAERWAYRLVPGGAAGLDPLGRACERDTALRAATGAELERAIQGSPRHARAASLLANVALLDGRFADARRLLLEARRVAPDTPKVTERLAMIAARDSSHAPGGR